MDVEVNEAGGEDEAGDVERLPGAGRGDGGLDSGDAAGFDGDIEAAVAAVARIDDTAAAKNEVEVLGRKRKRGGEKEFPHSGIL
jgi:hypothetical protein